MHLEKQQEMDEVLGNCHSHRRDPDGVLGSSVKPGTVQMAMVI